jgi:type IV pilus assembly protein PilV
MLRFMPGGDRVHRERCDGMTLVEVLVALVVISVGLLGIAALQMVSLRNSQGSYLRTQATALADDIIDRMRANRTAAIDPALAYNIAFGVTITLGATPTQAQRDLFAWKNALVAELPRTESGASADGSVVVDGNNIATVIIRWGERGGDAIEFATRTEM